MTLEFENYIGKEIEVSGRVNLNNILKIAQCGVDIISIGAITHSAPAFDFSLLF